jgi:hypothetical protein
MYQYYFIRSNKYIDAQIKCKLQMQMWDLVDKQHIFYLITQLLSSDESFQKKSRV